MSVLIILGKNLVLDENVRLQFSVAKAEVMLVGRGKCFEELARSKSTPLAESICSPMEKVLYNLRVMFFLASGLQVAKIINQPLLYLSINNILYLCPSDSTPVLFICCHFCLKLDF